MARLALQNSIEIQRLEQKMSASNIAVQESRAHMTPSLSLTATRTLTDQNKPSDVDKKESDYTISVSQTLYQPNLLLGYREAALSAEMASVQLLQARESILKETLTTILDICRIRARLIVTDQSLEFARKTVSIQEKMFKNGYGSKISLKEAEVELARYNKDYQELDSQLQLRLLNLSSLTGQSKAPEDFAVVSRTLQASDSNAFTKSLEEWVELTSRNNSQLSLLYINQKLSRISGDRVYNQFKPRIDLTLKHEQAEEEALVNYRTDESSIALNMSISFTPVRVYYQVQKQKIEQHALAVEEQKLKRDLENRIKYLLRSIEFKQRYINTQKEWKTRQYSILEMYEKGLKQKQIPFSQYLDSSRKYNESQIGLIQTFFDIWENRIELLHVSGQLTIEGIDELSHELTTEAEQG